MGIRGALIVLLSVPPVVLSLALLLFATRTGWLPVGGPPPDPTAGEMVRYLVLPVLALGLPIAAVLERLQSRAMADALMDRSVLAALARGIPRRRVVWRHAFRLSLTPVLAVRHHHRGADQRFVRRRRMTARAGPADFYDALLSRDANLVAGCAATGAVFLAAGIFLSDVALAAADPCPEGTR